MNEHVEDDKFVRLGVFCPNLKRCPGELGDDETAVILFEFQRSGGKSFFLNEEGLADRRERLIRAKKPYNETENAFSKA